MATLTGVMVGMVVALVMPMEWRDRLSRKLASAIRGMEGYMPDG